jgi:hypothetical protein
MTSASDASFNGCAPSPSSSTARRIVVVVVDRAPSCRIRARDATRRVAAIAAAVRVVAIVVVIGVVIGVIDIASRGCL